MAINAAVAMAIERTRKISFSLLIGRSILAGV